MANYCDESRFTLGDRLEQVLLDVMELLLEAAYTKAKRQALRRANLRLEVARHLWRLAHELAAVSTRRYGHGAGSKPGRSPRPLRPVASPAGLT